MQINPDFAGSKEVANGLDFEWDLKTKAILTNDHNFVKTNKRRV